MSIKNYTTQTNSHEGYTIEELRRLFGEGKQITAENLIKLINQCFNYELVSGEGIRIVELKNNDFRNNTTKTYKLECTGEGGGGGGGKDVKADFGVKFDEEQSVADKDTIIADLYDYTKNGDVETEGVYAVSLSRSGKLIVDMNKPEITVEASSLYKHHVFEDTDIVNNFTFTLTKRGAALVVYKIETWTETEGVVDANSLIVYNSNSQKVADINNGRCYLYRDCSARINIEDINAPVLREGKVKVYYTVKGVDEEPIIKFASTKFMHQIYYGYTCDYKTTIGSVHISPERKASNPNIRTQPCFKVYSNNPADYDEQTSTKRTGATLEKVNGDYKLKILNTETSEDMPTPVEYVLGYYDMTSSQEGKNTLYYLPTSRTFNLTGLGDHGLESVFEVFFIPKSMASVVSMTSSIDGGQAYSILGGMIVETALVNDYTYYNDGVRVIEGVEYMVYTQKNSFSTTVNTNINIECTVATI